MQGAQDELQEDIAQFLSRHGWGPIEESRTAAISILSSGRFTDEVDWSSVVRMIRKDMRISVDRRIGKAKELYGEYGLAALVLARVGY